MYSHGDLLDNYTWPYTLNKIVGALWQILNAMRNKLSRLFDTCLYGRSILLYVLESNVKGSLEKHNIECLIEREIICQIKDHFSF